MIRLMVAIFLVALGAVIAIWLALNPGEASFTFQGWEVQTSFAAAAVTLLVVAFLLALLWRGMGWLIGLPGQMRRAQKRQRAQRGYDALERALIASAAGDGGRARRQAARAGELLDRPLLTRVISARAAEAAGELESAESDYRLLLESPETQIVGLRGLAQAALARGDWAEAERQANEAFTRNPQARWAFEILFDAQARSAAWPQALETLAEGERLGHVPAEAAQRRRAVLLAADAASAERAGDADTARHRAETAHQVCAGFPPAAVLAARLKKQDRHPKKALRVIEDAWKAAPHPALAQMWRELGEPGAEPAEQAAHMDKLAQLTPDHRESRILSAESALTRGEPDKAQEALAGIEGARTARLCALEARVAEAKGDSETARRRILEAVGAPGEPDWSDVDPEGPAFAYSDEDWARLVFLFGDEGRLIHPRHERFQPELVTAPELRLLTAPPARPPEAEPAAETKPEPEPEPEPEAKTAAAAPETPEPVPAKPAVPLRAPPPAAASTPAHDPSPPSPDDPGVNAEPEDDGAGEDPEQRFGGRG